MICSFCDLNQETDQKRILESNQYNTVLFSNPRLMKGHLLVIPRRHVEKLSELRQEEREELFETVTRFQEKILSTMAGGCDVRHHYRPFIKDGRLKRSHLHIHLQPRELEDELYKRCQHFETDIFHEMTDDEMAEERRLLNSAPFLSEKF